jgi:hypothetical protein
MSWLRSEHPAAVRRHRLRGGGWHCEPPLKDLTKELDKIDLIIKEKETQLTPAKIDKLDIETLKNEVGKLQDAHGKITKLYIKYTCKPETNTKQCQVADCEKTSDCYRYANGSKQIPVYATSLLSADLYKGTCKEMSWNASVGNRFWGDSKWGSFTVALKGIWVRQALLVSYISNGHEAAKKKEAAAEAAKMKAEEEAAAKKKEAAAAKEAAAEAAKMKAEEAAAAKAAEAAAAKEAAAHESLEARAKAQIQIITEQLQSAPIDKILQIQDDVNPLLQEFGEFNSEILDNINEKILKLINDALAEAAQQAATTELQAAQQAAAAAAAAAAKEELQRRKAVEKVNTQVVLKAALAAAAKAAADEAAAAKAAAKAAAEEAAAAAAAKAAAAKAGAVEEAAAAVKNVLDGLEAQKREKQQDVKEEEQRLNEWIRSHTDTTGIRSHTDTTGIRSHTDTTGCNEMRALVQKATMAISLHMISQKFNIYAGLEGFDRFMAAHRPRVEPHEILKLSIEASDPKIRQYLVTLSGLVRKVIQATWRLHLCEISSITSAWIKLSKQQVHHPAFCALIEPTTWEELDTKTQASDLLIQTQKRSAKIQSGRSEACVLVSTAAVPVGMEEFDKEMQALLAEEAQKEEEEEEEEKEEEDDDDD